ncbi:uncharacterized protein LOC113553374 [Rhopalosiphum maidis]|uniref:uncharacterized protein LOC113553374 n=1 Tax=Rhopalosiphum maidis TaxID=43146 RepID=UPI000F001CD4|nr:uncharacterized protein LOC113553374 [Rhopalosiphum maidis]
MFVLSQAVISVFAFTVLLNVFYFDPTQSAETLTNFTSCNECTNNTCYTQNNNSCIILADNSTYSCLMCNSTLVNGDTQFYSLHDCYGACMNKSKCTCDGACYVCAIHSDPTQMVCSMPTQMVNTTCIPAPYVPPKNTSSKNSPTSG